MAKEILWKKALEVTKTAISSSALIPLNTSSRIINNKFNESYELRHLVKNKLLFKSLIGPKINPFNPCDSTLYISNIGDEHQLILNKYPVQLGHMLLITNNWRPQIGWLEISDFQALVNVQLDTQGLWFFNSGPKAGASQPHRHLQLLPRKDNEKVCPRDNWFKERIITSFKKRSSSNIFENSMAICSSLNELKDPTGNKLYETYLKLCIFLNIGNPSIDSMPQFPYNLLITKDWLCLIRRRKESAYGFSINSLGFSGYLLSTEKSDLKWLASNGLEKLLIHVSDPMNI